MLRYPEKRKSNANVVPFVAEDLFLFIHITIAFILIVVGIEILLPWTVWPLLLGVYLALWVGIDLYKQLWGRGLYILQDEDQPSASGE